MTWAVAWEWQVFINCNQLSVFHIFTRQSVSRCFGEPNICRVPALRHVAVDCGRVSLSSPWLLCISCNYCAAQAIVVWATMIRLVCTLAELDCCGEPAER